MAWEPIENVIFSTTSEKTLLSFENLLEDARQAGGGTLGVLSGVLVL